MLKNGFTEGHVITAHDIETLPDGSTVIHTYDNETRVHPARRRPTPTASTHRDREAGSQVIVNAAKTRWDYSGWHGGNDGSFYISTLTDWPAGTAPTLPGVVDAVIGIFGSTGGAAVTGPEPKGAEILPVLDRGAIPGAAGFVIGEPKTKRVSHVMEGVKDGSYDQMIMGGGFVGAVNGRQDGEGRDRPPDRQPRRRHDHVRGRAHARAAARGRLGEASRRAASRRSTRARSPAAARRSRCPADRRCATSTTARPTRFSFELQSVRARRERGALRVRPADDRQGRADRRQARRLAAPGQRARLRAPRERQGHDAPHPQPRIEPGEDRRVQAGAAQVRRPHARRGSRRACARSSPTASSASRCACSATAARSRARASPSSSRATRRARSASSCRRACGAGPTGCRPTSRVASTGAKPATKRASRRAIVRVR